MDIDLIEAVLNKINADNKQALKYVGETNIKLRKEFADFTIGQTAEGYCLVSVVRHKYPSGDE